MLKHLSNKRVLATLSITAVSALLIFSYAFAQPTTPPPGGNITPDFDSFHVAGETLFQDDDGVANNSWGKSFFDGYGTIQNWYFQTANNSTTYTNQFVLDADTGNIGMGNDTPTYDLTIGEDINYGFGTTDTYLAIGDSTNNSGLWLGRAINNFALMRYLPSTDTLNFYTRWGSNFNTNHLVLDPEYGSVGINSDALHNNTLLVKPGAGNSTPTEVVRGEYDTNNYGTLGKSNTGVEGHGTLYGVKGVYDTQNYGGLGSDLTGVTGVGEQYGALLSAVPEVYYNQNVYGVKSSVTTNADGNSYSGHFSHIDGSGGGVYLGLYADLRTGPAADLAEYILDSNANLDAADVVVADPNNKESVIKSNKPFDTSSMGVISTKPHMIMSSELVIDPETGEKIEGVNAAKLALAGRIPIKVTNENGQIQPGDLLTTSSTPGYAMKWTLLDTTQAKDFEELKSMIAENERRQKAVIGKALEPMNEEQGKIIGLLSLQ